jgi:hypothetical protein
MSVHRWTVVNPTLELELGDGARRDPRGSLPLELLETLDTRHGAAANARFVDAWQAVRATQVRPECYQNALELVDELEADLPKYDDRDRVRSAIADYLERELVPLPGANAGEYAGLVWKLRDARPCAAVGVDTLADEPGAENIFEVDDYVAPSKWARRERWSNRAGLVKLCPDDARCEQQRASKLYGQRLRELDAQGYVLRSAVFTLPNFPQWHLAAGLDSIFERFKQTILYARTDGKVARSIRDPKRKFPDLVGAWAVLEAPLSGKFLEGDRLNAWNVHLNLLLVFKPSDGPYGRPDYAPIHDAWGAGIRWRTIPQGSRDAMQRAILEVLKYPLQTVATKSAKDRPQKYDRDGNAITPAPPMIEWPAECFDEWWRAHKGFRRARSWGLLYAGALPDDDERSDAGVDWFTTVTRTAAGYVVTMPTVSTLEQDKRARLRKFAHGYFMAEDPAYRATVQREARELAERLDRNRALAAARGRLFLIQGNKSAALNATANGETCGSAQKTGPPDPD